MPGDFNMRVLEVRGHRPWPLPTSRPWVMTQTWHHLLFAHWAVAPDSVAPLLPASLELDLHDDRAWIGVVPFAMTNVTARGMPALPWLSAFLELNVRTYVRLGGRSGVYFFSLDAERLPAVWAARAAVNLPYFHADMRMQTHDTDVRYSSIRRGNRTVRFHAAYRCAGQPMVASRGTLDHFLTERYCLFVERRRGGLSRLDIHHPPWQLERADGRVHAASLLRCAGLDIRQAPSCLHYARRQDVLAWWPVDATADVSWPSQAAAGTGLADDTSDDPGAGATGP